MQQTNEPQKGITLDDLALMIKQGFDGVGEDMGAMKKELQDEVGTLRGEVGTLRGEMGTLRGEVGTLKKVMDNGFEKVNLRLDNVAHRFELVELEKRVDVLEDRAGVRKR
ncbi:MAG: hypothetical protein Q8R11_01860 [bacterium]|nr:hypothetical protein [bacterium]